MKNTCQTSVVDSCCCWFFVVFYYFYNEHYRVLAHAHHLDILDENYGVLTVFLQTTRDGGWQSTNEASFSFLLAKSSSLPLANVVIAVCCWLLTRSLSCFCCYCAIANTLRYSVINKWDMREYNERVLGAWISKHNECC